MDYVQKQRADCSPRRTPRPLCTTFLPVRGYVCRRRAGSVAGRDRRHIPPKPLQFQAVPGDEARKKAAPVKVGLIAGGALRAHLSHPEAL